MLSDIREQVSSGHFNVSSKKFVIEKTRSEMRFILLQRNAQAEANVLTFCPHFFGSTGDKIETHIFHCPFSSFRTIS